MVATNLAFISMSLVYRVFNSQKDKVIKSGFKSWASLNFWNIFKTLIINFFNFGIWGALFYVSFSFSAVYVQWANVLIVMWTFTFIVDFILMEVFSEILIMICYIFRRNKLVRLIMKALLIVKNLRNHH